MNSNQEYVYKYLKKSRLFSSTPDALLTELSGLMRAKHFPESEVITREGDQNSEVYFLIRGKISVYSQGEFILSLKRLGDMCGEMSVLTDRPCFSSEVAETPVDMLALDTRNLLDPTGSDSRGAHKHLFQLYSSMLADKLTLATMKARVLENARTKLSLSEEKLMKALKESSRANDIKSCFLDNINHELRTPMHGIMGMTSLLNDTSLNDKQKEYTELIQRSARKLMSNINDVLCYTNIETNQTDIDKGPFSLNETAEKLSAELSVKTRENKTSIRYQLSDEIPDLLIGDGTRIHQILINLLSFAINSRKRGDITVKVTKLTSSGNAITTNFSVSFSSADLAAEEISRLQGVLDRFQTDQSRDVPKDELGLFISKQLVEIMDGRIGVLDTDDKRFTFWFVLDLQKLENRRKTIVALPENRLSRFQDLPESIRAVSRNNGQILLIENDNVTRQVMERALWKAGYDVSSVTDQSKAVDLTRLLPFDLIMANDQDSNFDGQSFRSKMNDPDGDSVQPPIPIITYAPDFSQGFSEESLIDGIDERISYPVDQKSLRAVLNRWFVQSPGDIETREPVNQTHDRSIMAEVLVELEKRMVDIKPRINQFISSSDKRKKKIETHCQANEMAPVSRIARELKLASLAIGAPKLAKICQKLEKTAETAPSSTIKDLRRRLDDESTRVCTILRKTFLV